MTEKEMRCVKALRICHSHGDCRDCEFMESDRDEKSCVHVMFEDAADIIESLSERLEAAQPKWISVDNPPEEGGEYIVAAVTPYGKIVKTWDIYTTGSGWCGDKNVFEKVLYYMAFESLPEPQKEEV